MMLNLFSQFVNADSAISIDWHSQFLRIVKGLAIVCVHDPFVRERFFASLNGQDIRALGELYDREHAAAQAAAQGAAQAAAPASAQGAALAADAPQFPLDLRAAAAAKLKIADYRITRGLKHISDLHGESAACFATCNEAVAALFNAGHDFGDGDGSEELKRSHKEDTLELFSDTLCFYFDCLVESVPIIKRGLSPFCLALFARSKRILSEGSSRRRNAERVCKIATCLYNSGNSCGNGAFPQAWTGIKDLTVDDFIIEPVADVEDDAAPEERLLAGGGELDAVASSGDGGAVVLDFDLSGRPSIFRKSTDFRDFVESLFQTRPFGLYHRILAHDALDCTEWRARINSITKDADDAIKAFPNAVTCVFVDEMNTANCLGLISEAFSNHSMDGKALPASLFFVGAINPLIKSNAPVHQEHLGINDDDEYAMREFIVRPLPPCLSQMVHEWVKFSSDMETNFLEAYITKKPLPLFLTKVLNWEAFVHDGPLDLSVVGKNVVNQAYDRWRIQHPHLPLPPCSNFWDQVVEEYRNVAVELIVECQRIINEYSARKLLLRVRPSIRDILRCVNMWHWILAQRVASDLDPQYQPKKDSYVNPYLPQDVGCVNTEPGLSFGSIYPFVRKRLRQALYAAVAICYYIRLPVSVKDPMNPGNSIPLRRDFLQKLQRLFTTDDPHQFREIFNVVLDPYPVDFVVNWRDCVDHLWSYATKPPGIAHTDVLKENFYAVVVALHVKPTMPLLITGPAGASF
jgi:hypothetical protein